MRVIEFEYDGEIRLLVIGPDGSGRLLELIAIPASAPERVIHADVLRPKYYDYLWEVPMKTDRARDETGLDAVSPATHPARDAVHFRRILRAREALKAAEKELRDAVRASREAGDSWTIVAVALGTTRQAAQQRFGKSD